MSATPNLIEVALPLPVFQTFTYAVAESTGRAPAAGTRVLVPVRARKAIGICLGRASQDEIANPREVLDVLDDQPVLGRAMLDLCRWMSEYYVVPPGIVMRAVLPAALTGASAPRPSLKTRRVAFISREIYSLSERDALFSRSRRQRALFEAIESLGGRVDVAHLTGQLGFSSALIRTLSQRGIIELESERVQRDPFASRPNPSGTSEMPQPSSAQQSAIDELVSGAPGEVFLLHGITGSGKTLVYISFLRELVEKRGRTAIVLVPEIALTPQTVDRFRAVFGDKVAVMHSALGEGERYDQWQSLQRGDKRIVVGARSAVFAPVENLGAIILDEEHETSYKNGESPRYHARDVAIVRARAEGAVVVLGSATPSLESWHNADSGKYRRLSLPERIGGGSLPAVRVIDLRARPSSPTGESAAAGPGRRVIGQELEDALRSRLAKGEQSLVLLNRRGFASFLQCAECGDVRACPNCSITLTYHRAPERLVCHYCRYETAPEGVCERCGGRTLKQRGLGTQQVEKLLGDRFPRAVIARMDVDTTSGKWAHAMILDRVASGEVDILLGTQMIAKGLDFPNVTLVGVVDADVGVNLPDFRASERTFQLLSQVAGRAGRGPKGGEVIIQTRLPGHHSVTCALAHDYSGFVMKELPERAEPAYPPFTRLLNLVVSGLDQRSTADLAVSLEEWISNRLRRGTLPVRVIGPAPCAVERIHRRWRWHILLKSEQPSALGAIARGVAEEFEIPSRHQLRLAIDRDPVSLL